MTYMIYPYKKASEGAKALASALGGLRIRRSGSTYEEGSSDVIVNWGASDNPYPSALNADVTSILSKKAFFDRCKYEEITPRYALDKKTALLSLGPKIVCRETDHGKDGDGIVVWTKDEHPESMPEAVLYTEFIEKTAEYRVHIGRDKDGFIQPIGHQRKYKPDGGDIWAGDSCYFVWTINGCKVVLPEEVSSVARKTMELFPELAFAGLDIVYNSYTGKAFVLEANSAPTMTPKTVGIYKDFFNTYYGDV